METNNELTTTPQPRNVGGAPKGSKNRLKHGYYSLVKLVRNRKGALDKRTILGKMYLVIQADLISSLGGSDSISPQQQMLIDDVSLDTLLLKSLNNTVATVQPLRKGKAHAAYQLRASLIAQRREHLKLLGLGRRTKESDIKIYEPDDKGADSSDETSEGK